VEMAGKKNAMTFYDDEEVAEHGDADQYHD
jgi:hypothetical protein